MPIEIFWMTPPTIHVRRAMTCLACTPEIWQAMSSGWKTRALLTFLSSPFVWGALWWNLDHTRNIWQFRFNPFRIDRTEMTLAAVMNGKGNGNKDEVVQKIKTSSLCDSLLNSSCTFPWGRFQLGERTLQEGQWAASSLQLGVTLKSWDGVSTLLYPVSLLAEYRRGIV